MEFFCVCSVITTLNCYFPLQSIHRLAVLMSVANFVPVSYELNI